MFRFLRNHPFAPLSVLLAFALAFAVSSAAGSSKFVDSDDAKEKDEPQGFLKDYNKLVKGKEADWVYYTEGADLKKYKSVSIKFEANGKKESKRAAGEGPEYTEQWIDKSKLGWKVVKGGGDLAIEGNVFSAWEPSGAARAWGGWAANPGVGIELMGKDKSGKIVFQVRHKSKGSTIHDAVENAMENIIKTLETGR